MIQGRFHKGYAFLRPSRFSIPIKLIKPISILLTLFGFIKHILFGRFIDSNIRIYLLELFKKGKRVDPYDDSKNRYVVVVHKYDEKRKQIVPIRVCASSTLKGANKLAKVVSAEEKLPFRDVAYPKTEYVTLRYYSINEDLERSVLRHKFK